MSHLLTKILVFLSVRGDLRIQTLLMDPPKKNWKLTYFKLKCRTKIWKRGQVRKNQRHTTNILDAFRLSVQMYKLKEREPAFLGRDRRITWPHS